VLVVDDNPDAAESLAALLALAGHAVQTAHGGTEALAAVDAFRPDAALLDIGLPGMDGYELARRLRERGGGALRLAAVSGYDANADRERSLDAGFQAHFVKPVEIEALLGWLGAADQPTWDRAAAGSPPRAA
jgi:CheY-like chemotaxis protein